jgi:hypothetical protein
MLGEPERAEHAEAQQIGGKVRAQLQQCIPQPVLGKGSPGRADGCPQIQDEQRHGDGEQAVVEGSQALKAPACEAVVRLSHAHMMLLALTRSHDRSGHERKSVKIPGRPAMASSAPVVIYIAVRILTWDCRGGSRSDARVR